MTWVAVSVAGAAVVGGVVGSSASKKAAQAQIQSTEAANASNERIFNKQVELQEPFRQAGITGQNEFLRLLGLGGDSGSAGYGSLKSGFMPANWMDNNIDPGYNFRFSQGLKALQQGAAARGGFISGGNEKALVQYGQDAASQEYANAFNRYQTSRTNTLNPFASLAGIGQSAANTMTNAAGDFGARTNENIIGAGNARASGYVGQANAWTGALGGAANAAVQYPFYNYMMTQMNNPYMGYTGGGGNIYGVHEAPN